MASIDRHQYSEEIRKGAAKFVKDLNLDTKSPAYIPRKGVNGDSGMLKKVSNNLSSKLEYFQKLDKESVSSSFSLPRRSSAGSPATTNLIKNTSHINGEKSQEIPHLNGSLLTKTNGHGPEMNGDQRLKNRSSIGAIASFALGDTASHSVDTKLQAGLEAQISFSKAVSSKEAGTKVTPLSRLPGQNLNIGELVTSVAVTQGVHTAQVAMITNNTNGLNGVVFSRQSSVEKVTLGMTCSGNVDISTFQDILSAKQQIQQQMAATRRLSVEREKSAEKMLYQPGSYPSTETNNNPQIYENIETYIAGQLGIVWS